LSSFVFGVLSSNALEADDMFFTRRKNLILFRPRTRPGKRWLAKITVLPTAVEVLEDRMLLSATDPTGYVDVGDLQIDLSSYSPERILVQIAQDAKAEDIASLFGEWGDNETNAVTEITAGLYEVYLTGNTSVDAAIEDYKSRSGVMMAERDYVIQLSVVATPNDPSFSSLWGLNNEGQTGGLYDADIDALEAWDVTTGSTDVIVAVIDTGIDYTHLDLAGNMWTNSGEIAGNGIDDDGNGYVDDIYGYDFHNNDGDPYDDHGHGTHVAGTIAAIGDNTVGVIGVAPNVKVMALKFLSGGGYGYISNAVRALDYAVSMGAQISNNSWGGGGFSSAMNISLQNARNAGHVFVAAAGNSSSNNDLSPHYPSNYDLDNVISVAATDHNDSLAWFSSYGANTVDLAAPGVSIFSTTPGNTYSTYSGTSMATPHVTGVVALVMSQHPDWSYDQIINQVLATTDSLGSLDGVVTTGGRLNAASALGAEAPVVDRHGDTAAEATLLDAWIGTDGNIGTDTDTDWFQFEVQAGFTYTFDVSLESLTDSTLTLYGSDGTTVLDFDDNSGTGMGSQIVWDAAVDQTVYLQVDAKLSTQTGSYSILATHNDDHGNTYLDGTPTTVGTPIDGVIEIGGDVDFFSFNVVAGQTYSIATTLDTLSDSWIDIYDENGVWLTYNDDTGTSFASRLLWTADYTGVAHVGVEAYSTTQTGSYQLHIGTPTTAAMDSVVSGNLETNGDANFFEFHVDEGYTYDFETTLETLPDSWIDLYDADGNWIDYDDDGGAGYASRLQWTSTYTGNAFIGVEGYGFFDTGKYHLSFYQIVKTPAATSPLNGSEGSLNPTFTWTAEPGAVSYDFMLYDVTASVLVHAENNLLDNSYTVPCDLEIGHEYVWWTRADAASGYTSPWSASQRFTVVNNAPALDSLTDETMTHSTDTLDVNLSATDADSQTHTYTVEVLGDPVAQSAYDLDQQYGIHADANVIANNYYQNYRGLNERYLAGSNSQWFYILQDGSLYHWGGSIAASTLVGSLDSNYYNDPSMLFGALPPDTSNVSTSLSGTTLTIDPAEGYTGTFQLRVSVSDGYDTDTQTFTVTVTNNTPMLSPIADQTISHTTDTIAITLPGNDADGDLLTYSVQLSDDAMAQLAYDLDQQYGISADANLIANNYYQNYRGLNERYLTGSDSQWFYILTDGSLYHWSGSIAASTLVGTLDGSYYNNPSLLANAQGSMSIDVTAALSGSTLTIDPAADFVGAFQVTVAATDGVDTVSRTFTVTVTNNTPTLSPIADQTISHTTDTISMTLPGNDADGDLLTYSVELSGSPDRLAYDLDQQYNFEIYPGTIENNYFQNYRGLNERYLGGLGSDWFYILSDGSLYHWGGSIAASTLVGTLDGSYYNDPSLLVDAQITTVVDATATLSGSKLTIDPSVDFVGAFQVTVAATDGVDAVSRTFTVTVTNNTPTLSPVADQTMADGDNLLSVKLSASDPDGDLLTYSVEISGDATTQLAYDLDQQYGIDADANVIANNYYQNYRGLNERYLVGSSSEWFYILTDGSLYHWGGSIAASTLVGSLDSNYYNDPGMLFDAQDPTVIDVTATFSGSTLTLNPGAGFAGGFQVTVSVSDGVDTTSETFAVSREQAGGSSLSLLVSGSSQSIETSSTTSASETEQEETGSDAIQSTLLAGLFTQSASTVDSVQSVDETVNTRVELDLQTTTSGSLSEVVKAGDTSESSSSSSLDTFDGFLESLPGLKSISDLEGSDELDDVSDDDSDDLDKVLDRIFSESDGAGSDSSLIEKMMIG
jgi:subtilisin family serine protease